MITNSFSTSFRLGRSAPLFFVISYHLLIVAFCIRSAKIENIAPAHALMSIFLVRQDATEKLKVPIEKEDVKNARNADELKNRTKKPIIVEPRSAIDTTNSEQSSAKKTNLVESEVNTISSKELASLDSLARRYNLDIPKVALVETLTLAQKAAQDPRTNSARLTKSEKFAVALGALDCIFQTRLANGKVIRVPGHWVVIPARSEPGQNTTAKSRFCVRFHQEADEDGNDLTAILAGLKGK